MDTIGETLKKARYMRSFLGGRLVHVNMQVTYDCNFRCAICDFWRDDVKTTHHMTADEAARISDALATVGPQIVSVGGGEPLLNRELEGIVAAMARHHFPVMICNGWLMTEARARALFRAGMQEISVSVDYADAARHDAQRGREGAFHRAIEALEILQANRTHPAQRVNMISVIMDDNVEDVGPLIERCRAMGITYMVTMYSDRRGKKPKKTIPADVSAHLLARKAEHRHFVSLRGYLGRFSEGLREGGIGGCTAGKYLCNIAPTGDVSLCIDRLDETVGNLLRDDMATIVRRLGALREATSCKECWTSCRGSIESILHGGDMARNLLDYYFMTCPVPLGGRF